jgi:ABC-2 type transport system permease protein
MSGLMKAIEIARSNLVRQFRDTSNLFFVFVLPVIIIVALGLQFGGAGRARLGVVAPPGDVLARELVAKLAGGDTRFDMRSYADEKELRTAVERGLLAAGLVVPDDYSAALRGGGGAPVTIQYLGTSDALTAGLRAPVDAAMAEQAAFVTAARVAARYGGGTFDDALPVARTLLEHLPGIEVSVSMVGVAGPFAGFGQFTFGAQSQLVLFMFLTSMTAATQLVLSKRLGVSRRMLSTPTSIGTILAGETLGRFAVALVQGVFIVAVTWMAFGVSWGDPLAAGLLVITFGLVGAGVAMLIGAISTNAEQAGALGVFLGMALGALGGAMVPLTFMPPVMQSIAQLMPHYWAITGLQSLVRDGGTLASVAVNVLVLAGYGAALVALATWRFRKALTG